MKYFLKTDLLINSFDVVDAQVLAKSPHRICYGCFSTGTKSLRLLSSCGSSGRGVIAPEPAEHFGQHRATLLARVRADAPAVIHVVAFRGQRGDHLDVLRVPVPFRVVGVGAAPFPAIVVQAVLQKDADGFGFVGED